jgi:thiamine-phosphate pyrophosphorylase
VQRLLRTARTLGRLARPNKQVAKHPLPCLWLVTDPARLADPLAAAQRLPPGSGVVYRAFGAPDALQTGRALMRIARARRLTVLVGADEALAAAIGAHGLHLPERDLASGARIRARHPRWILTGAAHDGRALRRAAGYGLDAAFLSVVFASRSPSAARPKGAARFAALARNARLPVIALGGITNETAPGVARSGASGLAAVEGLSA